MGGGSRSQRTRAGIGGAPSTTGSERRPGAVFFCYWFLDSAPNHAPCFLLNLPDTVPRRIRPASRKDPANGPPASARPEQGSAPSPGPPAWSDGTSAAPPLSPPPRTVPEPFPNRPRRFRPAQVVGPVSLVTIAIIVMVARTTSRVGPRPALYAFHAHGGKRGRALAPLTTGKKRGPALLSKNWAITWQRPTLAGPNVLLPLAAEGLTAVFGMGTGGTPRLWSPRSESPFGESVKI